MRPRFFLLSVWLPMAALASGGNPPYELDWPNRQDVLLYRSCGCADGCWVAELSNRQSKQVKARLRCDCAQVFYTIRNKPEQRYASSCSAFADENKMKEITRTLRALRQ